MYVFLYVYVVNKTLGYAHTNCHSLKDREICTNFIWWKLIYYGKFLVQNNMYILRILCFWRLVLHTNRKKLVYEWVLLPKQGLQLYTNNFKLSPKKGLPNEFGLAIYMVGLSRSVSNFLFFIFLKIQNFMVYYKILKNKINLKFGMTRKIIIRFMIQSNCISIHFLYFFNKCQNCSSMIFKLRFWKLQM